MQIQTITRAFKQQSYLRGYSLILNAVNTLDHHIT